MSGDQYGTIQRRPADTMWMSKHTETARFDAPAAKATRNGRSLSVTSKADPQHAPFVRPDPHQSQFVSLNVPASARAAAFATAPPVMSTRIMLANAHAQGIKAADVRRGVGAALGMARNPMAWLKWSSTAKPAARYLARRMALNALADDVSDDDALALGLPVERQDKDPHDPHTGEEMLALIRRWSKASSDDGPSDGQDKEQFDQFLEDLVAGTTLDDTEAKALADELRHAHLPGKDAATLRALRRISGIEALHEAGQKRTRDAVRARIENEMSEELFDGKEGSRSSTEFNISPAFAGMSDSDKLIKLVADLVFNEVNVHQFGESVLAAMPVKALMKEGGLMRIVRALSDEISAATNLRNMPWLHEAVAKFGHVKIMVTLIEFCTKLSDQMGRLESLNHASAR